MDTRKTIEPMPMAIPPMVTAVRVFFPFMLRMAISIKLILSILSPFDVWNSRNTLLAYRENKISDGVPTDCTSGEPCFSLQSTRQYQMRNVIFTKRYVRMSRINMVIRIKLCRKKSTTARIHPITPHLFGTEGVLTPSGATGAGETDC